MDVSNLIEDAEIQISPGTTALPPREDEAPPDAIFGLEVMEEAAPVEIHEVSTMDFDDNDISQGPHDAGETFMIPQVNLEPSEEDSLEDLDFGADNMDGEELAVDSSDMEDFGDMLDDLDDE
jgi:hypothetical protein